MSNSVVEFVIFELLLNFRSTKVQSTSTMDEWKLRPERGDNHWFDCLVG